MTDTTRSADLQEKRDHECPAVPAITTLNLNGTEGVDGSSPLEGFGSVSVIVADSARPPRSLNVTSAASRPRLSSASQANDPSSPAQGSRSAGRSSPRSSHVAGDLEGRDALPERKRRERMPKRVRRPTAASSVLVGVKPGGLNRGVPVAVSPDVKVNRAARLRREDVPRREVAPPGRRRALRVRGRSTGRHGGCCSSSSAASRPRRRPARCRRRDTRGLRSAIRVETQPSLRTALLHFAGVFCRLEGMRQRLNSGLAWPLKDAVPSGALPT